MTYRLKFFCKATEEETAAGAMDRVLDALLQDGHPLLGEYVGPPDPQPGEWQDSETEAVHAFKLVTGTESHGPQADCLLLEIYVGIRLIAEDVIQADPDDAHGIWGSDLMAVVTLSGKHPDWPLFISIWTVLERLWSAVPWDEHAGFEIAAKPPRPPKDDPSV